MIVHITQDLMMSSTASAAARGAGHKFKFVASWKRALHFISENEVKFLIVDLAKARNEIEEIASGLSELSETVRPQTIAYAPHVEVGLLEEATKANFNFVLTRGQAHRGLAELLAS